MVAFLPLADQHGSVAGFLEQLADRNTLREVGGLVPVRAVMSDPLAMQPRQQGGPRGSTNGVIVELPKPQPLGREPLPLRRLAGSAAAPCIRLRVHQNLLWAVSLHCLVCDRQAYGVQVPLAIAGENTSLKEKLRCE